MWLLAAGLMLGMIIMFTPALGSIGDLLNGGARGASNVAMLVNGVPITELEVQRARSGSIFNSVTEGVVAADLQKFALENLVREEILDQASSDVRVGSGEIRRAVNQFRQAQGVPGRRNDQAYVQLLNRAGLTDQTFRLSLREQMRRQKYQDRLVKDVVVSEEEIASYYDIDKSAYATEERILARMLVLDEVGLALDLMKRIEDGESFQELASEYSLELAGRGGALGASQGMNEPRPVGRAALPRSVANAAFGLEGSGLTGVIQHAERFYVVSVEEYLPSQSRSLEEVHAQLREDLLVLKRAGVAEDALRQLRLDAALTFPEGSSYAFTNPVVAWVGDVEIREAELIYATYGNQQIQQALSPEFAPLIEQLFKPNLLEQLIEQELIVQGAGLLGANFIGTRASVSRHALSFVSRDAIASEVDIGRYYEENFDQFTTPASADATQIKFKSSGAAQRFRLSLLDGGNLEDSAKEWSGVIEDLGTVFEGDLRAELDHILFSTNAFEAIPDSRLGISDILVLGQEESPQVVEGALDADDSASANDLVETQNTSELEDGVDPVGTENELRQGEILIEPSAFPAGLESMNLSVLVVARRPEARQPLSEVRTQVETAVLSAQTQDLRSAWLDELREEFKVENLQLVIIDDALTTSRSEGGVPRPSSVPDSVTLGDAKAIAVGLVEELRSLATRDDLTGDESARLEQVQVDLAKVQDEVSIFTGAQSIYVVGEGETLSSIALAVYGDSSLWKEILAANSYLLHDQDLLFPGFVLVIPEL
jgi:parvulin-like peptidyl-prolyl isomerase